MGIIKEGKIARVPFCSIDDRGKDCADRIKEEIGAEVRGTRMDIKHTVKDGSKCVVCGKKASCVVYIAKSY